MLTASLEKVFAEASKLSKDEQDALASLILKKIASENHWEMAVSKSLDRSGSLAEEVFKEHRHNEIQPINTSKVQFTCLVKKDGDQYASLCIELDVASCGNTKKEAIDSLKNAIEAYLEYMILEGRENEIYRPVPVKGLKNFIFPEESVYEQSLEAISLEIENAYELIK